MNRRLAKGFIAKLKSSNGTTQSREPVLGFVLRPSRKGGFSKSPTKDGR